MSENDDSQAIEMLSKLIADQLISDGVPLPDAWTAAAHVIERLRETHGGSRIYVPSSRQQREAEIAQDWRDGVPPRKIADQRDVDLSTVYRVIKRQRVNKERDSDDAGFGSDEWNL